MPNMSAPADRCFGTMVATHFIRGNPSLRSGRSRQLSLTVIIRGWAATCRREPDIHDRTKTQNLNAVLAGLLVISTLLGLVTLLSLHWDAARGWMVNLVSGLSIASILGLMAGLIQSGNDKVRSALRILFRIGFPDRNRSSASFRNADNGALRGAAGKRSNPTPANISVLVVIGIMGGFVLYSFRRYILQRIKKDPGIHS